MENKHVFIGREKELETLQQAYKEAANGKAKLVLVEGSAGVGKSAFIREFLNYIKKDSSAIVGISECDDKENLNAYAPFKEVLIELLSTQDKGEKKNKLKNFIKDAGSSWVELIPIIGTYAKVGIETYEAYQDSFKDKSEETIESENDIFRIFENEFRRLSKKNTVVVFMDDLQWADASSLNLIFGLGKAIRGNPFKILFIGSYRANEVKAGRDKITDTGASVKIPHPFEDKLNMLRTYTKPENHIDGSFDWFKEISIVPFSKIELEKFINTRFPNNQFVPAFFETTYNISDGHPLFVVEILDYLETEGIITQVDGVFVARDIKIDNLPTSIDGVISEKVDRLNKDLLKVLTYASVDGEEFAFQIIERILNMDDDEKEDLLIEYLEELSKTHGLLEEGEAINLGLDLDLFNFSQSLVHKFVYKNMSNLKRKRLHKKVAGIMKELYGDMLESNKELKDKYNLHLQIGQGLIDGISLQMTSDKKMDEKSGKNKGDEELLTSQVFLDAASMEIQNAKNSFASFAMNETLSFVDKALAFLSKIKENASQNPVLKIEALTFRNKVFQWQGHYQKAYDTASEMANIASQLTNDELLAQANLALGVAKSSLGYNKEAIGFFEKSIAYYGKTDKYSSLWKAYYEAGNTNHKMAAYDEAVRLFKKALQLSDKITDKNIKARTLLSLGKSYSIKLVNASIVLKNYNEALEIFKSNNNQYWVGRAYNDIGNEYRSESNNEKALEYLEKALDVAKDQNDSVQISNRLNNIALVYEGKEEYDTAIGYYEKTLAIDRQLDDIPMIAKSMNNIGSVYTSKGDFETAMGYIDKSHEIIKSINNPKELSTSYYTLATAYKSMDNFDKAEGYFLKSIAIDKDIKDEATLALHDYFFGFFYYENNRYKEASKYLEESLGLLTKIGHKYFIAVINNTLGLIAKDEENYNKAIAYFKPALDYYLEVKDDFNILDIKENIANSHRDNKDYQTAIDLYKETIALAKRLENHTYLARLFSEIGSTYISLEKYDAATECYLKEVEINSENFGEESIQTANATERLANCVFWNQKFEESIPYYKKVLSIRTNENGDSSTEIDLANFNLAEAYYYANYDDKAKALLESCLQFRKENFGEDSNKYKYAKDLLDKVNNVTVTSENTPGNPAPDDNEPSTSDTDQLKESIIKEFEANFATAYQHFEKAEYPEAIENYEKALESLKLLPDDDATKKSKADIYFQMGQVNKYANDYDLAISNYINAYNHYIKLSEINKNDIGSVCLFLGDIYFRKDDYKNAIENHKEAIELLKNPEGSNNNMLAWAKFNLGNDYFLNKQYEEAIIYFRKALNIRKEIHGEEHREIGSCLVQIGKSYFEKGDKPSAIQNLKNAFEINKNLYGAQSREADEVLIILGQAYYYSDRKEEAKECLDTSLVFRKEFFGENSEEYKFVHQWIEDHGIL